MQLDQNRTVSKYKWDNRAISSLLNIRASDLENKSSYILSLDGTVG
jgi:hypothetical protein